MSTFETYASLRARGNPNALLVDAVGLLEERRGFALDVGAGPLSDTSFLLQAGLCVDAVDKDVQTVSLAAEVDDPRLSVVHADIRDVPLKAGAYALVVAIHVLPFLPRADLPGVVSALVDGLSDGGVLCCTFLGPEDSWAGRRPRMTFLSRFELDRLLGDLDPIVCSERRYDGTNAKGEPKRWHVLRRICRKVPTAGAPWGARAALARISAEQGSP